MLKGKVAIVTGGSRGIGYSIVKKYLDNGATVVLCGSKKETADAAVAKLLAENPNYPVEGVAFDLTSPTEVKEIFEYVKNKYGKLDILVNNAGISAMESIYNYDPERFTNIMNVNVNSVFVCSQAAAIIMKEQNNISNSLAHTKWNCKYYTPT